MKLKKEFLIHKTESETVLVPTADAGFSGVVRGNKTLGAILELLSDDVTEEEIISALKARFDAPENAIERDVKKAISELKKIGAIDE